MVGAQVAPAQARAAERKGKKKGKGGKRQGKGEEEEEEDSPEDLERRGGWWLGCVGGVGAAEGLEAVSHTSLAKTPKSECRMMCA